MRTSSLKLIRTTVPLGVRSDKGPSIYTGSLLVGFLEKIPDILALADMAQNSGRLPWPKATSKYWCWWDVKGHLGVSIASGSENDDS